jgi:WD40 repeat protein
MASEIKINRALLRWVALGLGVIGLIVMLVAWIATPGHRFDNTVSWVSLGVGVAGLAGFILLDPQAVAAAITGRTAEYGVTSVLISLLFVALIVGLYWIVDESGLKPIDLTEGGQYKLSEETVEVLENLDEEVHVVGFYTSGQESQREEAEIWLEQYKNVSGDKLTYEFVDPDRNPGEALRLGTTRSGVLVFEQGDRTAEATYPDERNLTGALSRVQLGENRNLYLVTGHGERDTNDFAGTGFSEAAGLLENANYTLLPLNLLEEGEVPDDASLVVIAGPQAQFSEAEVEVLREYMDNGGTLLVTLDPGTAGGALGSGVTSVDYDDDGTLLVTGGADGTAKVWDAATGEEKVTLRGHASTVRDVSFRAGGDEIATAGLDSTVRVWDAATGKEKLQPEGQTDGVSRVTYTADGKYLISVGEDQVVNVWDAKTYEPMSYSPFPVVTPLYAVAAAPDGSLFAAAGVRGTGTGGTQGVLYVWDAATGEEIFSQDLHSEFIFNIVFSPDGETLYSVARDGSEGTLDLETGEASTTSPYADFGITAVAVAGDGTRFYALGDNSIHIRPADATSERDDIILWGHTGQIWSLAVSPDGEQLASGSRDGSARIWDLAKEEEIHSLTGHSAGDQLIDYLADSWGIRVNDDLVVDLVTRDYFDALTPVMYNDDSYNATSPITQPLLDAQMSTILSVVRSVETLDSAPSTIILTPLLFSSGQYSGSSWAESSSSTVQFDEADVPGPVSLAVSAEDQLTGGRVVVVGDSDFASNNMLQYANAGNADLLLNTVNWLAKGEVIDLPSESVGQRLMDKPLSQAGLTVTLISGVCLIPLVIGVVGIIVWVVRRRRR